MVGLVTVGDGVGTLVGSEVATTGDFVGLEVGLPDRLGDPLGCNVGQSDTDGFIEGLKVGSEVPTAGASVGDMVGSGVVMTGNFVRLEVGLPDRLGDPLGYDVGQTDTDGFTEGLKADCVGFVVGAMYSKGEVVHK